MTDDLKEPCAPDGETVAAPSEQAPEPNHAAISPAAEPELTGVSAQVYSSLSDPYGSEPEVPSTTGPSATPVDPVAPPPTALAPIPPKSPPPPPPPPPEDDEDEDPEERGMLRMSFMEHLEELRSRLLKAVAGIILAFIVAITFSLRLWRIVAAPAVAALRHLGVNPPNLVQITPMEQFNVIYLKLPLLVSVFIGSPWIFYQIWAFISPGLYKREKRWATPFILATAGLFITGGCFAYFVAFRFGLEFLLGIGRDINVSPMVSINEYFDLFVNVTLGVGLVFEMPVIIFFLTLLRIASPRFLLRHSRYAILGITVLAAVVTPTPDAFNMMLFAVPMLLLYFVGLFAAFLLVWRREGKKFPWVAVLLALLGTLLVAAGVLALFVFRYHYHFILKPPYFVK